jgi:hypothetical protein
MLVAKQVADLITFTRAGIGLILVWLGVAGGKASLPAAVVAMLLDWIGDCMDGIVARRSRVKYHTWIGDHDLEVDIFVSAGLFVYLITAGYLSFIAGLGYVIIWILIFWRYGLNRSLGMLVQAPIYLVLIVVSLMDAPTYGTWLVVWIVTLIVLTWPRFPNEVIPGFLSGMRGIFRR